MPIQVFTSLKTVQNDPEDKNFVDKSVDMNVVDMFVDMNNRHEYLETI